LRGPGDPSKLVERYGESPSKVVEGGPRAAQQFLREGGAMAPSKRG